MQERPRDAALPDSWYDETGRLTARTWRFGFSLLVAGYAALVIGEWPLLPAVRPWLAATLALMLVALAGGWLALWRWPRHPASGAGFQIALGLAALVAYGLVIAGGGRYPAAWDQGLLSLGGGVFSSAFGAGWIDRCRASRSPPCWPPRPSPVPGRWASRCSASSAAP